MTPISRLQAPRHLLKIVAALTLTVTAVYSASAAPTTVPMTFVVNTESDVFDLGVNCNLDEDFAVDPALLPGPDGLLTLREAICGANGHPGPDNVHFNIPGPGPYTIILVAPPEFFPTSSLPITDDGTTIDGTTQPGYAGSPLVVLTATEYALGPMLQSSDNVIRGLAINNLSWGIRVDGVSADNNLIEDNYIGTDATGAIDQGNSRGVHISGGADGTLVRDNLISGNLTGVRVEDTGTDANVVQDNKVGTDVSGMAALGNSEGILVVDGASGTQILTNQISGNTTGIRVDDAATAGTLIQGNLIGTDPAGAAAVANTHDGIQVLDGTGTQILDNVISGNSWNGVDLAGTGSVLQGNKIGTDSSGAYAIPNSTVGYPPGASSLLGCGIFETQLHAVRISGAGNTIGGAGAGQGNLISGNGHYAISIYGGSDNTVQGNWLGTDLGGSTALPNLGGIRIQPSAGCSGGSNNLIGGGGTGEGNVISGNSSWGVGLAGPVSGNVLRGNRIGTDGSGGAALGNGGPGIDLFGGPSAGGPTDTTIEANVISSNGNNGITINGASTTTIEGNTIGTDVAGTGSLPNAGSGILLTSGPYAGPTMDNLLLENVIAHNAIQGVAICCDLDTAGNTMSQNSMFENATLGIDITGANAGILPPSFSSVSGGVAVGSACSGCTVELFAADEDPSGSGEGITFLGSGVATGGTFSIPYTLLCGVLTATATDAAGNTSEFSPNAGGAACAVLFTPLVVLVAIVLPGLAGGLLGGRLGGRARFILIGAIGGAALGATGLIAARGALGRYAPPPPSVQVEIPDLGAALALVTPTPPTLPTATLTQVLLMTDTPFPATLTATPPAVTASPTRTAVPVTIPPTSTRTPTPAPDTTGPSIKSVSDSPDPIKVTQPKGCAPNTSVVTAAISDPSGVAGAEVIFFHTTIGSVPMTNAGGNNWQATLGPYTGVGDGTVDYQIHAVDTQGNTTDSSFYQVTVLACLP